MAAVKPTLVTVVSDTVRILTFRRPSDAIATHWTLYFAFGITMTWLAGVGRYWDNPRAALWQHLGLGSVAYVFCLALVLWLIMLPMKPQRWSYQNVLLFVTLTSPLAFLYAIPVEKFMSLQAAQATNAWFLAIVAFWRLALLVWFLRTFAGLSRQASVIGSLLPIALIIITLSILNLEHVVFNFMGGIRGIRAEDQSPSDAAYGIVVGISLMSVFAAPFLLIAYASLGYPWLFPQPQLIGGFRY